MANLSIDIQSELPAAMKWLGVMRGQLPFAVSQALNKTGFDVRAHLNKSTTRFFNDPTPFTQRAFLVQKGNKADPTVFVYAQENRSYFAPQIRGGRRFPKELEGYIRGLSGGALTGKLVPTKHARDRRGNPRRAVFGQIARGLSTTNQGGFFMGTPKGSGRPPGVYRRSRGQLYAYFIQVPEPRYQPRFPMQELGTAEARRVVGPYLRSSLERALATAR
jgi:hypothetical protein